MRYLMVAQCLPNFFEGGRELSKTAPCLIGRLRVPSKRCHQAEKWSKPWGVRCSVFAGEPGRLASTDIEKWMKSERKPR